jgi:serine phosphatase RsbU (regulator of sigma subunit)
MLEEDLHGRFITVAYLLLTVENGTAQVSLACAGHPPPILVPGTGDARTLPSRGTLLGIWPDIRLQTTELALGHGDTILLYTDGVSDPGPGPERRPTEALREHERGADAGQLADALERYATQPAEAERDDIAIVAVRFTGRTQPLTERASVSGAGASSSQSARNPPTTSSR